MASGGGTNVIPVGKSGKELNQSSVKKQSKEEEDHRTGVCRLVPISIRNACRKIVENVVFSGVMTVLTVYALFGDDIKLCTTNVSADLYFNIFTIISLIMFSVEIFLGSIGRDDYFMHFFFWLDVMSTASLATDITWVWEQVQDAMSTGAQSASSATRVARAGRAGRAGSRAGRIVRIVRIVRLIRIAKLYKHTVEQQGLERSDSIHLLPGEGLDVPDTELPDIDPTAAAEEEEKPDLEPESRVGKKLSELTTKRVIILVLVMLFSVPVFDDSTYNNDPEQWAYGMTVLARYANEYRQKLLPPTDDKVEAAKWQHSFQFGMLDYIGYYCDGGASGMTDVLTYVQLPFSLGLTQDEINEYSTRNSIPQAAVRNLGLPAAYLAPDTIDYPGVAINTADMTPADLRTTEMHVETHQVCDEATVSGQECPADKSKDFLAYIDKRASTKLGAALNLGRTVFICIVLALGAMFFSKDANDLVLNPIERMIAKVERIRDNPLVAAKMGEEDSKLEFEKEEQEKIAAQNRKAGGGGPEPPKKKKGGSDPYETVILEKTIIKIGGLLALGFGEAGGEIIANNMKTADGGLNAMVEGRKIQAIFGFCDIRQFTDATEILREKVMVFVNQIASIVHGIVDQFSGSANKNIGDAFLLVWKFPEKLNENGEKIQITDVQVVSKMADMSLMAFIKIQLQINKSAILAEYRENKELCDRIPNYRVKMGFGLHVGWAIEGAIGSEFKVDASYLSPNVNMASRLEAATKQYGVPLLISGALHEIFTPQTQTYCRQIDRVTVKGSKIPMPLFTVDTNAGKLKLEAKREVTKNRYKLRRLRETQKAKMWSSRFSVYSMFESDPDLLLAREHVTEQFMNTFRRGYANYEAGEWLVAKDILSKTQKMLGEEDGPSTTLLHFMAEHNFQAPEKWAGFRELTEK